MKSQTTNILLSSIHYKLTKSMYKCRFYKNVYIFKIFQVFLKLYYTRMYKARCQTYWVHGILVLLTYFYFFFLDFGTFNILFLYFSTFSVFSIYFTFLVLFFLNFWYFVLNTFLNIYVCPYVIHKNLFYDKSTSKR